MPALSIGDLALYTLRGSLYDQKIISTYGYLVDAITGTPDLFVALDALIEKLNDVGGIRATYLGCCPPEYHMEEEWAQKISPTRFRAVKNVVDEFGLFTDGQARTANSAASITRRGDEAVRAAVSTLHVPIGQSGEEIAEGRVTQALLDALNVHAAQIKLDVTTVVGTVTWTPVIPNPANPGLSIVITDAFAQDTVRVMRRRTVGLGI